MPRSDDDYRDYDDANYDDSRYEDYEDYEAPGYGPPPRQRSGVRRWLLYIAIGVVALPLTCCGGLLVWSMTYKTFDIKNGRHMGGPAVNVMFEYEVKTKSPFLDGSYKIVAETADGHRFERDVPTRFESPGHFSIHRPDSGPAEKSKSPIRVWIEKNGSRDSNVLRIPIDGN